MEQSLKISAVSFLNTVPFVYGLKHGASNLNYTLSLDVPSECARKLQEGEADLGLAPVAILPELESKYILPGFCIGSNGPVRTVILHSPVPLQQIKFIRPDKRSRTSNLLLRILVSEFWNIQPEWEEANDDELQLHDATAELVIGDRNFELFGKYPYQYDLSSEWKKFTGLPFVFACWVATRKLTQIEITGLSKAFQYGLDHLQEAIDSSDFRNPEALDYLKNGIDFVLDKTKMQAMDRFLSYIRSLKTSVKA